MKVIIERTKEEKELDFKGTAEDLLSELEINMEEVIVARNGTLVTLETEIGSDDEIKILSVISGG